MADREYWVQKNIEESIAMYLLEDPRFSHPSWKTCKFLFRPLRGRFPKPGERISQWLAPPPDQLEAYKVTDQGKRPIPGIITARAQNNGRSKSCIITAKDRAMAAMQTRYSNLSPSEQKIQEEWAQDLLEIYTCCPKNWGFYRIPFGYRCYGMQHLVTDELLAEGEQGFYFSDDNLLGICNQTPRWVCPNYGKFVRSIGTGHQVRSFTSKPNKFNFPYYSTKQRSHLTSNIRLCDRYSVKQVFCRART